MVYLHLSCDDSIDWADNVYMEPDAINGIDGYEGLHLEYITKDSFYTIWGIYVNSHC